MKKIDTKIGETTGELLKEKFGERFDWESVRIIKCCDGSYDIVIHSDFRENSQKEEVPSGTPYK